MKNNHSRSKLGLVVLLLASMACVLPSQATQPTPAANSNAIQTAVASTAQVAVAQTVAAAQSPASETPVGMTGTAIEQLPDGITKYTDYDGGFEVTFRDGWLAVRPNSEEFDTVLAREGAVNSMLQRQMMNDQSKYDARYDRLFSYALRPDIKKNVIFGFSTLAWIPEDAVPINDVEMGRLVQELETSGDIPGFHVRTAQLYEYGAFPIMEIGGRFMIEDGQGGSLPFYATIVFFKPSPTSTVRITFTFLEDYHLQIYADVQFIMGAIKLIE